MITRARKEQLDLLHRRWERALRAAKVQAGEREGAAVPGERS